MLQIREPEYFSMAALLLLLCCVFTTSLSAIVVFQSPESINTSVNNSFTLTCTRDLPITYCYNTVSWYKVSTRNGELSQIRGKDELGGDKKSCSRTITNAQVKDSGVYYCTSIHDKMFFVGSGTRVVITDTTSLNPSIVLYTPAEVDTPYVLLQCVVMDMVTSQISVWWLIGGHKRTGWTESGWTGDGDLASEYTRAQIRIPAEEWWEETHSIECVVTYGNKSMSRTLQRQSSSCAWLLYGACAVAVFTIVVVITVALYLRKEKQNTFPVRRHHPGVNTQRKYQTPGKRDTCRTNQEQPTRTSEVEYSCLNPDLFKRQPNPQL